MDFTILSSAVTIISFVTFVGIWYWAFNRNNKARFEQLAHIALEGDEAAPSSNGDCRQSVGN